MRLDVTFRRFFPFVVCALVGAAAFFQASGFGSLVAASTMPQAGASRPATTASSSAAPTDEHATSASAILGRNPFDSTTGPLDGSPPLSAIADESASDEDPPCKTARVVLIVSSDDPAWSFATFAASDGKTQLRRAGDDLGDAKISAIGWDRVWLARGASRCQVKLGDTPAAAPPPPAGAPKPKGTLGEIADKIRTISDHEVDVQRSVIDTVLEHQAELMSRVRVVPEKEGDRMVGLKLFGVRSDSLLGMLGLANGDRLGSINGFELTDPQKALEAYSRLRTADHLTLAIVRQGKPMNIDINVR